VAENQAEFEIVAELQDALLQLRELTDKAEEAGQKGERAFTEMSRSAEKSATVITGVNQALELAAKGLNIFRTAISAVTSVVTGAVEGAASLVREYEVQEKAALSVAQALSLQGEEVIQNTQRARDFADHLERVTGRGNETVLSMQALAIASIGSGEAMERAVRAAIDLSAGTGQGLNEALKAITRSAKVGSVEIAGSGTIALQASDQYGRLEEAIGLVEERFAGFAETQKNATGTGSLLTDLDTALASLRKGLGEVIDNTPEFQAAIQVTIDVLDRLTDGLGKSLPAATKVLGQIIAAAFALAVIAVESVVDALVGAKDEIGEIADGLDEFLTKAGRVAEIVGAIIPESRPSPIRRREMPPEVEAAIDADDYATAAALMDAAVAAAKGLAQETDGLAESEKRAAAASKSLGDAVQELLAIAGDAANADQLRSSFSDYVAEFRAVQSEGTNSARAISDVAAQSRALATDSRSAANAMGDTQGAYKRLKTALEEGVNPPKFTGDIEELDPLFRQIGDASDKMRDQLLAAFDTSGRAGEGLIRSFAEITDSIDNALAKLGSGGAPAAERLFDIIQADLEEVGPGVADAAKEFDKLLAKVGQVPDRIKTQVDIETTSSSRGSGSRGDEGFTGLADATRGLERSSNAFDAAVDEFSGVVPRLGEGTAELNSAADQTSSAAVVAERAASEQIEAANRTAVAADAMLAAAKGASAADNGSLDLGKAAAALSGSASRLNGAAGAITEAAKRLANSKGQGFRIGGIIRGPTQALVGEAGPEIVLPLDTRGAGFMQEVLSRLGGGGVRGGGVHVTVSGNTFLTDNLDELAEELERRIASRLVGTSEMRI